MVIFGWGKRGKEIAYLGVNKCPNCKNYGHFALHELANQVRLYFVPVANFNKKYYMVCGVCDAAWEVDSDQKSRILRESVDLPSQSTVGSIWNELDGIFSDLSQTEQDTSTDLLGDALAELNKRYSEDHVGYVARLYFAMLTDADRPK